MNLKLKHLNLVLLFFITLSVSAQETLPTNLFGPNDIKTLEDEVALYLKKSNYNESEVFYLTLLAARELFLYRYYKKAKEYYQKAIAINSNENKSEAYINLIAIAIIEEKNYRNNPIIKKYVDEADNYYKKMPAFFEEDIKTYITGIHNLLKGQNDLAAGGYFGEFEKVISRERLIKEKKFQEVLISFNPNAIFKSVNIDEKVHFDLVNVLVNEKKVKKLACGNYLEKYPKAYSYSIKVCSILNDYLKGKSNSKESFSDLENYFKDNHVDKKYLLDTVKLLRF